MTDGDASCAEADQFRAVTHGFAQHKGQPAPLRGNHGSAESGFFENARELFQKKHTDGTAHGMGKEIPRPGHFLQHLIRDSFEIFDIFLKPGHVGQGKIGDFFISPGTAMAPLIIGQHAVSVLQQTEDQLTEFCRALGKSVQQSYCSLRGFRIIAVTDDFFPAGAGNGDFLLPFPEPWKHGMIHGFRVLFTADQPFFAEKIRHCSPPVCFFVSYHEYRPFARKDSP